MRISALEAHVQTILDQKVQNADCFVVVRNHEEQPQSVSRNRTELGSDTNRPRSTARISPATPANEDRGRLLRSAQADLPEVNQFLRLPVEASRARAQKLMEYARLKTGLEQIEKVAKNVQIVIDRILEIRFSLNAAVFRVLLVVLI
ncbi:unnamed protein product [Echinostoma caproni]|uniref:Uncharacterized protein n=1 Tax=Echinostoma caproni TaxID=27848 RepID=A0A182ZZN0_9TREM|nr:unnamed protein product [Echinostoma caproni]